MTTNKLIKALQRLKVETEASPCLGCGHEHNLQRRVLETRSFCLCKYCMAMLESFLYGGADK